MDEAGTCAYLLLSGSLQVYGRGQGHQLVPICTLDTLGAYRGSRPCFPVTDTATPPSSRWNSPWSRSYRHGSSNNCSRLIHKRRHGCKARASTNYVTVFSD